MQFGLIVPVHKAVELKEIDYLEGWVGSDEFSVPDGLPVRAAALGLGSIIGPRVDLPALRLQVQQTCEQAARKGIRVITFSGDFGHPIEFDAKQAKSQVLEFLRMALPFFARHEIMLVAGASTPFQSCMMSSLPEVLQYVWQIDHPWFQVLLDTRQVASRHITLEQFNDALPWIRHVHAPGPFPELPIVFSALKRAKYDDLISVTETYLDLNDAIRSVRQTWSNA